MGLTIYIIAGVVTAMIFDVSDDGRTVGSTLLTAAMWPLVLVVAILRVRI